MSIQIVEIIVSFGVLFINILISISVGIFDFFRQFIYPRKKDVTRDVVLITGGAGGLGRLMCVEFAKLSREVVAWDINKEGLLETADLVKSETGATLHTFVCNCGDRESIRVTAEKTRQEVGEVSILINNAGIVIGKLILDLSEDLWEKTFRVNLMAHFWTTREFLPDMRRQGRGHLVYVVSSAGDFGSPRLADYCSSKAAGLSFCDTLSGELALCGLDNVIKTTCVAPFIINTTLFEGCELKYPLLTPHLDANYVVQRIIAGILSDQKWIGIGRSVYWMNLLKSLLPTKILLDFYKFSGATDVMNSFKK